MAIITLTTDLGLKDYYASAIRGAIYMELPDANVVDITHLVPSFNIQQAAYILKNAYPNFPAGSIHIIGVNAEAGPSAPHLGMKVDNHYFIGTDNGIFSLLFDKKPEIIVELNLKQETDIFTFPTRDIFVKAACHLARGGTLEIIGKRVEGFVERTTFRPVIDADVIRGSVIYMDNYFNVVYNITEKMFRDAAKGRAFMMFFKNKRIERIHKKYGDVQEGELLAFFNSSGYLEIAQNKGQIGRLMNVQVNEPIIIEFVKKE